MAMLQYNQEKQGGKKDERQVFRRSKEGIQQVLYF
jgi:hypothetical protein